jgi:RsiW-degrading membrane proteinase PrsW (M82 family)
MPVLLLLIFIAALPVIAVFLWFRFQRFPMHAPFFLCCLLAGALSVPVAALVQYFIPLAANSLAAGAFNTFVRIALVEEGSRLPALLLLKRIRQAAPDTGEETSWAAASGLISGLGFALIESAAFGAVDIRFALLRDFTAAPLHGACGARVGLAALSYQKKPGQALWRFLSAVAIHGAYNMLVVSPRISFLALVLSYSSFFTSIRLLYRKQYEEVL